MKPFDFDEDAERELAETAAYYKRERPGLAADFLARIHSALHEIRADPRRSARVRGNRAQKKRVKQFPYRIIYREYEDRLAIIATAHGSRRPGYWRHRESR